MKLDDFSFQDGPRNDQKLTQDDTKRVPKMHFFMLIFAFDFGPFWDPFWVDLGSLLRSQIDPKSAAKIVKNHAAATYQHNTTRKGPKTAPRGQTPLRTLKIAPRGSQDPPKRPQEGPKASQDLSKRPQECSQRP